MMMKKKKRF
jgi:hypothetical protein